MKVFNYPFLDFNELNNQLNEENVLSENKLEVIYEKMNGKFLDKKIMSESVIGICSIGGLPIHLSNSGALMVGKTEYTKEELKEQLYETLGMSSFMSYLNPKNKSLKEIADTTLNMKHYSVLHTINLSIFVCGITSGVEHELSSQRDIIHLSRLTVAKTKAQNNPCLVLNNKEQLNIYKKVLNTVTQILSENEESNTELRNLLFPSAKASAIVLTGSLKNFMKLIALKDSGGKEEELINLLIKLENLLKGIFPELFN